MTSSDMLIVNDIIIDTGNANAGVSGTSGILSMNFRSSFRLQMKHDNYFKQRRNSIHGNSSIWQQCRRALNGLSALYNPTTSISVYQNGTTSNTVSYVGNPIGSTVSVDRMI